MAAPRLLPDKTTLERHVRHGWTYKQIAEQYGVTETAVYFQLRDLGLVKPRKISHKELIPWAVKAEHQHQHVALMLRLLSRRRQGLENSRARTAMLDKWLKSIGEADVVVCYDPEMPPNPASKTGGWFYSRRQPKDGQSIIRFEAPGEAMKRHAKAVAAQAKRNANG